MKDQQAYQSIILVSSSLRAEDLRFRVLGGAAVREDSSRLPPQQASLKQRHSFARSAQRYRTHARTPCIRVLLGSASAAAAVHTAVTARRRTLHRSACACAATANTTQNKHLIRRCSHCSRCYLARSSTSMYARTHSHTRRQNRALGQKLLAGCYLLSKARARSGDDGAAQNYAADKGVAEALRWGAGAWEEELR